MNVSLRDLRII